MADLELNHTFTLSYLIAYTVVASRSRTVAINTYCHGVRNRLFRTYVVGLEVMVFTHRGIKRSQWSLQSEFTTNAVCCCPTVVCYVEDDRSLLVRYGGIGWEVMESYRVQRSH